MNFIALFQLNSYEFHFYEFLLVSIFVHVKFKILFSTIESYLGFCKADENYIFLLMFWHCRKKELENLVYEHYG